MHELRTAQLWLQYTGMIDILRNFIKLERTGNWKLHLQTLRDWAGLSSDLVIEQVLMRSLKRTGGLTRGRGVGRTERLVWLLSNPVYVEVNNALQEYTSVRYSTTDQHKEPTTARKQRDTNDTQKLLVFVQSKNPFNPRDAQVCIALTLESLPPSQLMWTKLLLLSKRYWME